MSKNKNKKWIRPKRRTTFDERISDRAAQGRVFGWVNPPEVQSVFGGLVPANDSSTATNKKCFFPGNADIRAEFGLSGVIIKPTWVRLVFLNTAARDAFREDASAVRINGVQFSELDLFVNQSSKNIQSTDSAIRAAAASVFDTDEIVFEAVL